MAPEFLKAAINSDIGKRQIGPITQGVAQKKVSLGRFSGLAVPVPPTDEQASVVQILGDAEREAAAQLSAIELSLKQSVAQRQNILRAAFAGQLVLQDPTDEPATVLLERISAERAERAKQPKARKSKQQKEIAAMVRQLIDVLAEAGDWVPAQEAFRLCGVAHGALTDQIEALYAELRQLDKEGRLASEPVFELNKKTGKKVKTGDRLKLVVR
jgi:type I restriction enzyme, S subunit